MRTKAFAVVAVVAFAVPIVGAQAPAGRGGQGAPPPPPPAGTGTARGGLVDNATGAIRNAPRAAAAKAANDLRLLTEYNAFNALGMLRGANEQDQINTPEIFAAGTMTVGGQTYKLTDVRLSYNYYYPGVRMDFKRTGADSKEQRVIQVVQNRYAWTETTPGMGAVPAPVNYFDWAIRMWTLEPFGVVKAFGYAGEAAKVTVVGTDSIADFPVPSLGAGATMKVTMNAKHLIDKVETRVGANVYETTFSDYNDWNPADQRADVFSPKRMTQKVNGMTVLDLTVDHTNTYNPYIIIPIPPNVEAAGPVPGAPPAPTPQPAPARGAGAPPAPARGY